MVISEPYFMKNSSWYYIDEQDGQMKLTKKGLIIPEVYNSYIEFMQDVIRYP